MATTVNRGASTITVDDVLDYRSARSSGNVISEALDIPEPAVRLGVASLRSGTLRYLIADEGDAFDLEQMHAAGGILELADDDVPAVGMSYVCGDTIELELDGETRTWTLAVDFQEVPDP